MSQCNFCKDLKEIKIRYMMTNDCQTYGEIEEYGEWMQELTVAIVERNWYQKRGKRSAGRTIHYKNQGIGFALNFCPECGKRLR